MEIKKKIVIFFAAIFSATVLTMALLLLSGSILTDRFALNTVVGGQDLSYKTKEDAIKILDSAKEKFLKTKIKISLNDKFFTTSFGELGTKILTQDTVYSLDPNKLGNLPVLIRINEEKVEDALEKKFKLTELSPKSATFYFDGKKQLQINEEKEGLTLDKNNLISQLKEGASSLSARNITIVLESEKPEITKENLLAEQEKIKQALERKITLIDPVYRDDWTVKLKDHLDWVGFKETQKIEIPILKKEIFLDNISGKSSKIFKTTKTVAIDISQQKLDEFVDTEISKWLDVPTGNVNIYKNKEGKIIIEGSGYDGKRVDRKLLKESMELALLRGVDNVSIPVVTVSPEINISQELKDMGIKERIAVGHTSYYGSPANRAYNISVGAEKMNAILVAPDEIFSFNKHLGPVEASTGYKMELVIKPEGTIPEFGGGLCQLSTTFYRAMLLGGFPIIDRQPHSYAVSYYSQVLGYGLDATIYQGGQDLKFKNDTGHNLLIQTSIKDNNELFVVFYGTDIGRKASLEGPYLSNYHSPGAEIVEETDTLKVGQSKQAEKAHMGFNALWYRYITNRDGEVVKEEIKSSYKAVPAKRLVGTAEE